ncbi:MAG: PEGA domain-containing protein [Deltaproteobacteria bacterium]|nr:PEGA domain-containing protein [Deltaproteobacteria bacterium]MBI3295864.1 PEGA domain-containing protein [Deltaproteobacteria bacterium]
MKTLSIALATLLLSGCATIFSDHSDDIRIESEPTGADVFFQGRNLGKTPLTARFPRSMNTSEIRLEKSGYNSTIQQLDKRLTGEALWNLGFITTTFGATSWGIDALSGKMLRYAEKSYVVALDKKGKSSAIPPLLQYATSNFEPIQKHLAQNDPAETARLCETLTPNCPSRVATHRDALVQTHDGLELYRKLMTIVLADS